MMATTAMLVAAAAILGAARAPASAQDANALGKLSARKLRRTNAEACGCRRYGRADRERLASLYRERLRGGATRMAAARPDARRSSWTTPTTTTF